MFYINSEDVPETLNPALEKFQHFTPGMRIHELLDNVSCELQRGMAIATYDGYIASGLDNAADNNTQYENNLEEDYADDANDDVDEPLYFDHNDSDTMGDNQSSDFFEIHTEAATMIGERIRQDLRTTKLAGFKIGILCGMKPDSKLSILSISVQVVKLGLSEETIDAWDLQKQQYIVLLIKYFGGYETFDAIISNVARSSDMGFRVGTCNRYKPTMEEASAAFAITAEINNAGMPKTTSPQNEKDEISGHGGFQGLFISCSLNGFMNKEFIALVKIRHCMKLSWEGAKRYLLEQQAMPAGQSRFAVYFLLTTPFMLVIMRCRVKV